MSLDDKQIVELYWQRSELAIVETDRAYGRYFLYIAYQILRDDRDSEEVVNDTYLKAWDTMPPERPNPLKAFLGRITRQLSINRLEKRTAEKRGGGDYDLALEELQECIADNTSDIGDLTALQDALNRFLLTLPTETRRIFLKRYWYMSSIADIARDLGISQSKVKMQLLRTREKLKAHLIEEGFDQ